MSSDLVDIFLLSLVATFNPTLLTAVTVMLLLPKPKRLMVGYLLGAYTSSISLGLLIVFALPHAGAPSGAKSASRGVGRPLRTTCKRAAPPVARSDTSW